MAHSSIPGVIDYLVSLFRGLSVITAPDSGWVVFDGLPGPNIPDSMVVIGGAVAPTAAGAQQWAAIGAQRRDEDYMIDVTIETYVGGSSDSQGSLDNAQKIARDKAFAVFSAFDDAIRGTVAKVTLNSLVNIQTEMSQVQVEQTDDTDDDGKGRRCSLVFAIHVRNRI